MSYTCQFYPAADTVWLCFACNKLSCIETYPLFARVPKTNLPQMNGDIGDGDKSTCKICSMNSRKETWNYQRHLANQLMKRKNQHKLELEFWHKMVYNKLRCQFDSNHARIFTSEN